jgi:hypothetical protein
LVDQLEMKLVSLLVLFARRVHLVVRSGFVTTVLWVSSAQAVTTLTQTILRNVSIVPLVIIKTLWVKRLVCRAALDL